MPQLQIPIFPEGSTEVNANLAVTNSDNQIVWFYGLLPIFTHDIDDLATFRMFTSQLYINGNVKQSEICKAFGVSKISVKRSVKLYREKGAAGFYTKRKGRGASVLTAPVLEKAQLLFDQDYTPTEVGQELDIKPDTLRKAISAGKLHRKKKSVQKN